MTDLRAAGRDAGFRRAYRELGKVVPALPCRIEDAHVSRWAVVDRNAPHSAYTKSTPDLALIPAADAKPATTIRPRRRRAVAAA